MNHFRTLNIVLAALCFAQDSLDELNSMPQLDDFDPEWERFGYKEVTNA